MGGKEISLEKLRQRDTRRVAALFLAPVAILMAIYVIYPIIDTFVKKELNLEQMVSTINAQLML
ncbi:MAG: hypothetical protein K2P28_00075, partial [Lachnospiraceae bacterium]|nr:hypothetical protein [Lachnospiraceae bacterium]